MASIGGVPDPEGGHENPSSPVRNKSYGGLSVETVERLGRLKKESQGRLGYEHLTNDQFMQTLLDVYEYHLDTEQ